MRRLASTAALVLAGSALLTQPAGAMPGTGHEPAARGGLTCETGLIGFDSGHHVRYDSVVNDRVVKSQLTTTTLPFDVTAWGYYDASSDGHHTRLQLNVISADGVPRSVTLNYGKHTLKAGNVKKYDQRSFKPRLFADNYTYYAYTVNGGTMKRWTLTRFSNGDLRYAQPVKLGGGFGDLTSLQATAVAKVHGVESEILYGTTSGGQLRQIVVPFEHPTRARVHKLAASGYEGVTELSWTVCNTKGKGDLHSLIAIDPTGNRASWTTIKHAYSKPKATLRGDVTGATDWNLTASL
jgi:hypothetical protein